MKESNDQNVTAHNVLNELLQREEMRRELMREMGRRGGRAGGPARAKSMTAERRSEIARKAGSAPKKQRRKA